MEEVRYSYSVKPRRPIKNVGDIPVIRTPKSLKLTLEEVLECLPNGPVYRRFVAEDRNERVTRANAARLHNEKFMTEEEYEAFLNNGTVGNNLIAGNVAEEPESDGLASQEHAAPVEVVEPEAKIEETATKDIVDTTEAECIQETVADEKDDELINTSADDHEEVSEEPSIEVVESDSIDSNGISDEEDVIDVTNEVDSVPPELDENVNDVKDYVDEASEVVVDDGVEANPRNITTIQIHNNSGKKKKHKNRN